MIHLEFTSTTSVELKSDTGGDPRHVWEDIMDELKDKGIEFWEC
jgi:hypothetical protein